MTIDQIEKIMLDTFVLVKAALDKEREREVVLGEGKVDWFANNCGGGSYGIKEYRHPLEKVNGQAGTLIFRPANQEDKK